MKGDINMTKKSNSALFSYLLYILIGAILVIFRSGTLGWVMTIVGCIFATAGILELIGKRWVSGAVCLIIGLTVLILGWAAAQIVLLVLGILIAIKGVVELIDAVKKNKKSVPEILYSILSVVIGLMLAFGNALDIMIVIVGILLIVDGIIGLFGLIKKHNA